MTTQNAQAAAPGTVRPVLPLTPADDWMGISYEKIGTSDQQAFLRPTAQCLLSPGSVSAGVLPVLSDAALGWLALHATSDDRFIVTSNMHVDVLGRPDPAAVLTVVRGRVLAVDDFGVTLAGDIVDTLRDQVVASTTARFAVVPLASRNAGSVTDRAASPGGAPEDGSGGALGDLGGVRVGDDPVSRMFQLRLASQEDSLLCFVAGTCPELANDRGGLHGGVAAMLGQHVGLVALGVVRPEVPYRCVESRTVYLRPVPSHGAAVRCRVRVLHHGRRQAVVTTSLLDSQGDVAVESGSVFAQDAEA